MEETIDHAKITPECAGCAFDKGAPACEKGKGSVATCRSCSSCEGASAQKEKTQNKQEGCCAGESSCAEQLPAPTLSINADEDCCSSNATCHDSSSKKESSACGSKKPAPSISAEEDCCSSNATCHDSSSKKESSACGSKKPAPSISAEEDCCSSGGSTTCHESSSKKESSACGSSRKKPTRQRAVNEALECLRCLMNGTPLPCCPEEEMECMSGVCAVETEPVVHLKSSCAESGDSCCGPKETEPLLPVESSCNESGDSCCGPKEEIVDLSACVLNVVLGAQCDLDDALSDTLQSLPGVESCVLDSATSAENSVARITFDPDRIGPRSLLQLIQARWPQAELQAEVGKDDSGQSRTLRVLLVKLIVSVVLCVPLLLLSYVFPNVASVQSFLATPLLGRLNVGGVIAFVVSTPVVALGFSFYRSAVQALLKLRLVSAVLISTSVLSSYLYSAAMAIVMMTSATGPSYELFFEVGPILLMLLFLGHLLEGAATRRSLNAVAKLKLLQPSVVSWLGPSTGDHDWQTAKTRSLPLALVERGDYIRIRPGESIPIDGVVVASSSSVDESLLTGESLPVAKGPGDELSAGTMNLDAFLIMKATRIAARSTLSVIAGQMILAQKARLPVQRLTDKASRVFLPTILSAGLVTFAVWTALAYCHVVDVPPGVPQAVFALQFAISVLVISCPCAFTLAVPLVIAVATGHAASLGVLVAEGSVYEVAQDIDAVILDKTGTLTTGELCVAEMRLFSDTLSRHEILGLLSAAEQGSEHVVARAIEKYASQNGVHFVAPVTEFRAFPGLGLECVVDGKRILVGTEELFRRQGVPVPDSVDVRFLGTIVAVDAVAVAALRFTDTVRDEAAGVVQWLKQRHCDVWIVSGDSQGACQEVARTLGVDQVRWRTSPEGKAAIVSELERSGRTVAFVGDGLNDSVALAASSVGVSLSSGTDIAREAADVVLLHGLAALPAFFSLSTGAFYRIRFGVFWAFFFNAVGLVFACGAFYTLGVVIPPAFAGLGEVLSTFPIILAALSLRLLKAPRIALPAPRSNNQGYHLLV